MPTLLVDNPMLGYANAIVVDGVNVYWDEVQQAPYDTLTKCAVDGCEGNPTSLASGSQVRGIAVDSASVYWTNGAA